MKVGLARYLNHIDGKVKKRQLLLDHGRMKI